MFKQVIKSRVMNKLFLICCLTGISVISSSQGSEASKIFYNRAISEINPKHVQWIKSKAAEVVISKDGINKMHTETWRYLNEIGLETIDPNAIAQLILRASYLQTTEDLKYYAEKVKYFNQCKKLVRDYLQKLREDDANMKESMSRSEYDSIKKYSLFINTDMTPPSNPNLSRVMIKKDSLNIQTINRPVNYSEITKAVSPDEIKLLITELEQKERILDQNNEQASVRMKLLTDKAQKTDSIAASLFTKYAESGNAIIDSLK